VKAAQEASRNDIRTAWREMDRLLTKRQRAKLEALKEINSASDRDSGMVIVFNSKATTLQTYTNDKEKLREAVAGIQQSQRPTRIEEALALAGRPRGHQQQRCVADGVMMPNRSRDVGAEGFTQRLDQRRVRECAIDFIRGDDAH